MKEPSDEKQQTDSANNEIEVPADSTREVGLPGSVEVSSQRRQYLQASVGSTDKEEILAGLPEPLKTGIEVLSGLPMDDVTVHYDSSKPAEVQALAYTEGTDIYLGPGQQEHLAHEAWHVVQQKQGRVKPTLQAKGMAINDEEELETEAGAMGYKALELQFGHRQYDEPGQRGPENTVLARHTTTPSHVIQRMWDERSEVRNSIEYKMWMDWGEGSKLKDGFWYKLKRSGGSWDKEDDVEEVGSTLPDAEKKEKKEEGDKGGDVEALVKLLTPLGYKRASIYMEWGDTERVPSTGWKLHAGCDEGHWVAAADTITKYLRGQKLPHKVMVVRKNLLEGSQKNKLITVWTTKEDVQVATVKEIDKILAELSVKVEDAQIEHHIMVGPTSRVAMRYGGNQTVTAATLTTNKIGFKQGSMTLPKIGQVTTYEIDPGSLAPSLKAGTPPPTIYEGPNGGLRVFDQKTNPALLLHTEFESDSAMLYPDSRDNPLQNEELKAEFPKGLTKDGMPNVTLTKEQWAREAKAMGLQAGEYEPQEVVLRFQIEGPGLVPNVDGFGYKMPDQISKALEQGTLHMNDYFLIEAAGLLHAAGFKIVEHPQTKAAVMIRVQRR